MKYSILLQIGVMMMLSAISIAQSQHWLSNLLTLRKCKRMHGVQEDIQGCLLHMTLPKDKKSYCAIACIFKELGLMYNDYSIDAYETEALLKKLNLPIDNYIIRTCNIRVISTMKNIVKNSENDEEENECQAAEILMRCINELSIHGRDYKFNSDSYSDSYSDFYSDSCEDSKKF